MRMAHPTATAVALFTIVVLASCSEFLPHAAVTPRVPPESTVRVDTAPEADLYEVVPGGPPASAPAAPLPGATLRGRASVVREARARLAAHISSTYRIASGSASQIVEHAYQVGAARHLRPTLLLAVIAQESSFRPEAISRVGAVGLMQVRPELHDRRRRRLGLRRPLADPATNIAVGADVLLDCLARSRGNVTQALEKYSGGASDYSAKVAQLESKFERVAQG
ncbi:MAG TPA: lytic transglycosylase domain-containing protein [Burkholderiaceae bacterium]|nr:lytic transglycosylase domain-containing protein [Burkholderiaceae bacterium]